MPDPVFEATGSAKRGCADFMVFKAGVVEAAALIKDIDVGDAIEGRGECTSKRE